MKLFHHISAKQLLLIGIIIALMAAIPLTLLLLRQTTETTKSNASRATVVSFTQGHQIASKSANPTDQVSFDIWVDPGTGADANLIANGELEIKYDPPELIEVDQATCGFTTGSGPLSIVGTPICTSGDVKVILNAPPGDPTKLISQPTKIGTITFKALTPGKVNLNFGDLTVMKSSATSSTDINGKDPESNVISQTFPASIDIGGSISPTGSVSVTPTGSVSVTPTGDTPTPTLSLTPTISLAPPATQGALPVCVSITSDTATGVAPVSLNFTATGSDPISTLTQATFNFGDGTTQNVTVAAGTATPSPTAAASPTPVPTSSDTIITPTDVPTATPTTTQSSSGPTSVSASHTYAAAGTFQASVIFTDAKGQSSQAGPCTKSIIVTGGTGGGTSDSTTPSVSITPALPVTGPAETIMGIGVIGIVLTIIGAAMFFVL